MLIMLKDLKWLMLYILIFHFFSLIMLKPILQNSISKVCKLFFDYRNQYIIILQLILMIIILFGDLDDSLVILFINNFDHQEIIRNFCYIPTGY